jgi:hypothetical protein
MTSRQTIDLHAHTLASDGSDTPLALVGAAAAAAIGMLAVTDRDTVEGLGEALEAAERVGVEVLPSCEVTGDVDGRVVHLLAYGQGLLTPGAIDRVVAVRRDRQQRNLRVGAELEALTGVGYADALELAGGSALSRVHFARALVRRGAVADVAEAFDRYLSNGRPPTCPRRRCRPTRWSRWSTRSGAWWCWRTPAGSARRSGTAWWRPRSPPGSTASRSGTGSTTTAHGATSWWRPSGTDCWPPAARTTTAATSRGSASAAAPTATCRSPHTPPTT